MVPISSSKGLVIFFGGSWQQAEDDDGVKRDASQLALEEGSESGEQFVRERLPDGVGADIDTLGTCDSSNVSMEDRIELIERLVRAHGEGCQWVIILHGTDTIAWTACAILLGFGKMIDMPIFLVGSQLPLMTRLSDLEPTLNASLVFGPGMANARVTDVFVPVDETVFLGAHMVKVHTTSAEYAGSPNYDVVGWRSREDSNLVFDPGLIRTRPHGRSRRPAVKPELYRFATSGVVTTSLSPGLDPDALVAVAEVDSTFALLLLGHGPGNGCCQGKGDVRPAIDHIVHTLGKTVVIGTQNHRGVAGNGAYEVGQELINQGAIPAGYMTVPMTETKLLWARAQGAENPRDFRRILARDIAKETTRGQKTGQQVKLQLPDRVRAVAS